MHWKILNYCNFIKQQHIVTLRFNKKKKKAIWDYPAMAVVCIDSRGKHTCSDYSKTHSRTSWNQLIITVLKKKKLGAIGEKNKKCKNTLGHCAEQHAGNAFLNKFKGAGLNDIFFTESVRPRTMQIFPSCKNCKSIFPNL